MVVAKGEVQGVAYSGTRTQDLTMNYNGKNNRRLASPGGLKCEVLAQTSSTGQLDI